MESFFILENASKTKNVIAVKNGFSLNIFFLGPLWGLFKGLWSQGLIWLLLISLGVYNAPEFSIFFILVSAFFWGIFGRDIYIQMLLAKNYTPLDIVNSNSPRKAILIFSTKSK